MKRKFLTLLLALCALPFVNVKAQEFMPFYSSPYSGITSAQLNPASIAGSKYKFDVTLFGASSGVHNDLLIFSRKKEIFNINFYQDMWSHRSDFFDLNAPADARTDLKYYLSKTGSEWDKDSYGGYFSGQIDILNMMYSFTDRLSIGLGYRQRWIGASNDVPEGIAQKFFEDKLPGTPTNYTNFAFSDATTAVVSMFKEIDLTIGYTLLDKSEHKLKVGGTAKFLFGGKSAFAYAENYTANLNNNPATVGATGVYGEAGRSTKGKFGIGGDLGVEYEYRPASLAGNEIAEYRLKAGVSVLDLGGYKNSETNYQNLSGIHSGIPSGINDLLAMYGSGTQKGDYTMSLPMVITGQVDYRFAETPFFLNFTPYIAMGQGSAHKAYKFTSFNLIPHAEWKNFGVSVPLQYDQYGKFTAGLGLRAWRHIWIGSNTILKNLWPGDNRNFSADIHVMAKIPILKKSNDRDGDGVPDDKDECPDTPGLKKYNGCPDSDGDGIPDNLDKCPNEAGPVATGGCPDRDGDGIIDKEDRCPDQPGPASTQGCPDRDGDGIADIDDACPDQAGPKATKGCPDRDGDGIADKDDRCPDQAGPASLQGCPDTDGDGVADIDDKCPTVPGPKENFGCPVEDKGIKNIEFDIDKFNIRPEFTPVLDKVVEMLTADPNATVTIVGHTDNTYTRPYNMNLSKRRAESVKNYLVKKKVAAKRIKTSYFGPDKPIATNDTAEGRQKNRRAEITIVIK